MLISAKSQPQCSYKMVLMLALRIIYNCLHRLLEKVVSPVFRHFKENLYSTEKKVFPIPYFTEIYTEIW